MRAACIHQIMAFLRVIDIFVASKKVIKLVSNRFLIKNFQVGRLHQRQLLDDDQREIRLFKEAFLEDGELHSDNARTRRFKWKDAGTLT